MNSVKLYSNGMAVISRDYALTDEPLEISIPVRTVDLCDAVGTITVQGDVSVPEPPSYEPVGANETALTLDPENVDKELATKLAGSKVKVIVAGQEVTGTLTGIQEFSKMVGEHVVDGYRVSILKENGGHKSWTSDEIEEIVFTEEQVQSEVEKALQRSFAKIKPNSSFIKLKVVPNEGAKSCTVVYAVPAASWKIRYHLHVNSSGNWNLQQQAVVDNDTDDNWHDSLISCIVGEPITFATDLAEIRRPTRSKVNVVASHAQGAVDVSETIPPVVFPCMDVQPKGSPRAASARRAALSASAMRSAPPMDYEDEEGVMECAAFGGAAADMGPEAEYRESGDYAVFDSAKPVTILSERSAIVPLVTSDLDDGNTILLYNERNDNRRPFRAVRFKNTTDKAFGKGVCEIMLDGELQGKAVLQAAKQGEEVSLVYCKETGVKVFKEHGGSEQTVTGLRIGNGIAIWQRRSESYTDYKIENVKGEEFTLEIEHTRSIHDSTLTAKAVIGLVAAPIADTKNIANGVRVSVTLPPNSTMGVRVHEKGTTEQQVGLGRGNYVGPWLQTNLVNVENPVAALAGNAQVKALIEMHEQCEAKRQELGDLNQRIKEIDENQERLGGLIDKFAKTDAAKYQSQLAANEEERATLESEAKPALTKELRDLEHQRDVLIRDFTLEWTA